LARPSDSLTASQLSWLAVQRDWRAQRDEEALPSTGLSSLTPPVRESEHPHFVRRSDARFAALASRPYAALADSERAWLVAENAAQLVERGAPSAGGGVVGVILLAGVVGAAMAYWVISSAFSHGHWP
jgi:hypothetical protein